jgi:serine/threonine protein kinase
MINNKYEIIEKIGIGTFGNIYKGRNIRTNEMVAIKMEEITNEVQLLKNESRLYYYLNKCEGIPKIKWYGICGDYYCMVMELLGESLENLKNISKEGKFSLKLTLTIGIKIINIIQRLHNKFIIHRDIKPDNLLLSNVMKTPTDSSQLTSYDEMKPNIYIIDLGFSKKFINDDDTHIIMKPIHKLIGTPNFASINSHQLCELSRRDDLESIAYTLIYLYYGKLPWQNLNINTNNEIKQSKVLFQEKIKTIKNNVLYDFLLYSINLQFNETPDYNKIIDLFSSV